MKIHIAAGHPNFETVALPADKHARLQMCIISWLCVRRPVKFNQCQIYRDL